MLPFNKEYLKLSYQGSKLKSSYYMIQAKLMEINWKMQDAKLIDISEKKERDIERICERQN